MRLGVWLWTVATVGALQAPHPRMRASRHRCGRLMARGSDEDKAPSLLKRFTDPQIDDEGLVIADALISGIVAPGLEAGACVVLGVPPPTWTRAFGTQRLVAPTLLRGFNLATAWLGGALAARLYERAAYDFPPPDGAEDRFATTFKRCLQAGAFATALLIVSTQVSVVFNFGVVQFGDDPETDVALLRLADDLIRDVTTEALVLLSWRLTRTSLSYLDDTQRP